MLSLMNVYIFAIKRRKIGNLAKKKVKKSWKLKWTGMKKGVLQFNVDQQGSKVRFVRCP